MSVDPVIREHQEWLGFIQPVGLVVSPTALKNAQARVARNIADKQEILLSHTREITDENRNVRRKLNRFTDFAKEFWGWEDMDLASPPDNVSTVLQEYGEILRPDFAVPGVRGESEWQILIQQLLPSQNMDQGGKTTDDRTWQASPQIRFERLLRDTGVPIGLLVNSDAIRLVYAPKGETAGHLTFPIHAMCETAGRPIVAALHLLLDAQRLFALPKDQRLPAILQASRKYQNEVSIQLAGQVLRALNELCRGFNEANRASSGTLLRQMIAEAPEEIYGGLLTTLMRLVFLLYAEDRSLMVSDEVYQRCYGLIGLHEKLREDAAAYPDTMDQRFGAWAQVLTLSRLVHDGGGHGPWRLPARRGRLFDPDSYPFLEGRPYRSNSSRDEKWTPPKVADGVLYRVLEDLLYLDGERISYRALDVEQIGSVYEAMMGFNVEVAHGPSIGLKPDHIVINLGTLLEQSTGDRKKWLKETVGWEPAERAAQAVKAADSTEELLGALNSRISPLYTDRDRGTLRINPGDIYLQPTEERRRSGSHYTPRSLTEPIVRTTLDPVLQELGENPTPAQILDLKVCDPAMGSGAFLVEACRYLADRLVKAWAAHKSTPDIPADQDPLLNARRVVAQRCLYGVDKNPFAVDLSKLSLWLATFAKDHPFTFLDHSLRHGDSLVGLTFNQIVDALGDGSTLFRPLAETRVAEAVKARRSILDAVESTPYNLLYTKYELALQSVGSLRDLGDAIIAAFLLEEKPRDRARRRTELVEAFDRKNFDVVAAAVHCLRTIKHGTTPFHWETELPEVFENGGFSAIIGNPPFLGGKKISGVLSPAYLHWIMDASPGAGGQSDLVAYFFRRSFSLLREHGTLGLVATNTISQGDTRTSALTPICRMGGEIIAATRRVEWPGAAVVHVSAVHIFRGNYKARKMLDGIEVEKITAFLLTLGPDENPSALKANKDVCFKGVMPGGNGFLFEDGNNGASTIQEMRQLIHREPQSRERIFPFLSGEDILRDPRHAHSRYIVDFYGIEEKSFGRWSELAGIVEQKVSNERRGTRLAELPWWCHERSRPGLRIALQGLDFVFVHPFTSTNLAFARVPANTLVATPHCVFASGRWALFCTLQSRIHEIWVRTTASTLKDDIRYTPTDCFETFPFPREWKENEELERIGEEYYQFRADLMVRNNQGLTATYNRFHDKYEDDIEIHKLRDLHAQMDRAVLDAYGWTDLKPVHDFILDYEEPEDEQNAGRRNRKEPWRYRWTDEFRDEVLARLLELNRQRADEEQRTAASTAQPHIAGATDRIRVKKGRKKKDEKTENMYAEEVGTE